ncbi:MAG: hypothetical protein ACTSQH_04210 [Candidatus Hodarchaeales archaeon]
MVNRLRKNWIFILLLLIIAVYMCVYIYQTSFISNGTRYFVLFDDAMISMRFAKNFAEGNGLVWNPGETPLEGYTNPLWVVYMAIFHLFPIPAPKISLFIQLSGAFFLLANLVFVKKIAEEVTESLIAPYLAVILTALYVPLNNWSLQGMEVCVLVLMISAVGYLTIHSIKNEKFSKWIYILLFLGTFVRMDMVVPYLVYWGFLIIFDSKNRMKHILWGAGFLAFSLVSQSLFRHYYYGYLLPNTYYLKMTGMPLILRLKRGLFVLYKFIRELNWVLFILPFMVLLFRYDKSTLLLAVVFLAQLAYSVYVGGDAWEHKGGANRYISVAIPLFFVLFVYGWEQIKNSLLAAVKKHKTIIAFSGNIGVVLIVFLSMLNFNFLLNNQNNIKRIFLLYKPLFIEANKENVRIAHAVKKITTQQAEIAVIGAGSIPYFSERQSIDILGKIDSYIAHLPSRIPSGGLANIRPGHMKWDYEHTFGKLKPDLILGIWGDREEAEIFIDGFYTAVVVNGEQFLARNDSTEILWEKVEQFPE